MDTTQQQPTQPTTDDDAQRLTTHAAPRFVGVTRLAVLNLGADAHLLDLACQCADVVKREHGAHPFGVVPLRDPVALVVGGVSGTASLVANPRGLLAFRDALDTAADPLRPDVPNLVDPLRLAARVLRGAVDDALEGTAS